ncbi:MAG: DUF3999 family protein, partial [Rubrivivax sp.]|nr:DUF3999 family protein [Rubrivivax sp.]
MRAADGEAAFRHRAPIAIEQPGAFMRLPLPASAYAMSRQAGLADLRVVDARGERVPFALLGARAPRSRSEELARPVHVYPLPALRAGEKEPASPLEVQVVGDRITVRRLERRGGAAGVATAGDAARRSPGWLFDLGERRVDGTPEGPPALLRLAWSGPAEFIAGYQLELSDDLKQWRRAGGGQVLALQPAAGQPTGTLAQRDVPLPRHGDRGARFVRLRWLEPQQAPVVIAAQQVRFARTAVELDAPTVLAVPP